MKPANGKEKKKPEGDLIRRSELLAAIKQWAKSHALSKMSPKQVISGITHIIRSL